MSVKCGSCDGYHEDRHGVRACFAAKRGLAEAREVVKVDRVASPRKFQPRETFGQTLRRHTPEKPTCWACSSTDIEYRVVKGKQVLCCDKHPKTTHPDYVETPEIRANSEAAQTTDLRRRKRAAQAAGIDKPAPRSTIQPNGRRKFRAGCEPGTYDGKNPETDEIGRCRRCVGTGMFITGMLNGKPTGPGGPCFRCGGNGKQTDCGISVHLARYEAIMNNECDDISACCDRVRNDLFDRFRTVSAY
jgi:hypothetical protein